jgi:hypothetical protein
VTQLTSCPVGRVSHASTALRPIEASCSRLIERPVPRVLAANYGGPPAGARGSSVAYGHVLDLSELRRTHRGLRVRDGHRWRHWTRDVHTQRARAAHWRLLPRSMLAGEPAAGAAARRLRAAVCPRAAVARGPSAPSVGPCLSGRRECPRVGWCEPDKPARIPRDTRGAGGIPPVCNPSCRHGPSARASRRVTADSRRKALFVFMDLAVSRRMIADNRSPHSPIWATDHRSIFSYWSCAENWASPSIRLSGAGGRLLSRGRVRASQRPRLSGGPAARDGSRLTRRREIQ